MLLWSSLLLLLRLHLRLVLTRLGRETRPLTCPAPPLFLLPASSSCWALRLLSRRPPIALARARAAGNPCRRARASAMVTTFATLLGIPTPGGGPRVGSTVSETAPYEPRIATNAVLVPLACKKFACHVCGRCTAHAARTACLSGLLAPSTFPEPSLFRSALLCGSSVSAPSIPCSPLGPLRSL